MTSCKSARLSDRRGSLSISGSGRPYDWARADAGRAVGLTVYGCEPDEAELFDELGPTFGVVPTVTSEAVSESSVISVPGTRCVSVGHKSEVSGRTLRALRAAGVEYVSTRSIGVDHIDLDTAASLGITVDNVVYAPDGVADFTLMLILMAVRRAKELLWTVERCDFRLGSDRGRDLCDMTIGVLGLGNIGTAVVNRLLGFGCRVLACGNSLDTAGAANFVSLDDLLRESDVVTLHLPLNGATHHLLGREQLAAMRSGAFLINTGRGALVDTEALIVALENGKLGGAALDVLEGEEDLFYRDCSAGPVDHQFLHRLQRLRNVIVTPHTAYYTERALRDTVERTLMTCLHFERRSDQ